MKKLSRKHKIALIELVLVLLIALYFFAPRPFSLAMGSGFDREQVTQIQVDLTNYSGDGQPGRTLRLDPADQEAQELLDRLEDKWYFPYYVEGDSRQITLDYAIQLTFSQPEGDYCCSLTGDRAIDMVDSAGRSRSYQVSGSEEFQRSLLDFLLQQEYTIQE